MSENNKAILEKGNAAIARGNNEGFLSFCAETRNGRLSATRRLKGKRSRSPIYDNGVRGAAKVYG